nr:PREDICTED: myosin-9-like isoform X1 [Bemisia tabaci]
MRIAHSSSFKFFNRSEICQGNPETPVLSLVLSKYLFRATFLRGLAGRTKLNPNMDLTLKESLSKYQATRSENKTQLRLLTAELNRLQHLQFSQEAEINELHQKLAAAQDARAKNMSTAKTMNSKLKALSLTRDVLADHHEQQKNSLDDLKEKKKKRDTIMNENHRKQAYLEEQFLKSKAPRKSLESLEEALNAAQKAFQEMEEAKNLAEDMKRKNLEREKELERECNDCREYHLRILKETQQKSEKAQAQLAAERKEVDALSEELEKAQAKTAQLKICAQEKQNELDTVKKSNNEWLTGRKANLKQLKKKLEVADVSIKENEESSEKLQKELAALTAKAGAAQQEETCLGKKLAEENTIVANLQQLNTDAESHRTDLTKKITTLECESKNLKIKMNSLQNEVGNVEKETISVKEKIVLEDCSFEEMLANLVASIMEETKKVAKLESDCNEMNENQIKLKQETEMNVALKSENASLMQKYISSMAKEKISKENLIAARKKLEALKKTGIAVDRERLIKFADITNLAVTKDSLAESLENDLEKMNEENEKLKQELVDLVYEELEEAVCFESAINKLKSESDKKIKAYNKLIVKQALKLEEDKKDWERIFNEFNSAYRKKCKEIRRTRVTTANLMENIDKVKLVEANLTDILFQSLEKDRVSAQNRSTTKELPPRILSCSQELPPRRLSFSQNLEKFSPLELSQDSRVQPIKSILKKRVDENKEEPPKKPKSKEDADPKKKDQYFPNFDE